MKARGVKCILQLIGHGRLRGNFSTLLLPPFPRRLQTRSRQSTRHFFLCIYSSGLFLSEQRTRHILYSYTVTLYTTLFFLFLFYFTPLLSLNLTSPPSPSLSPLAPCPPPPPLQQQHHYSQSQKPPLHLSRQPRWPYPIYQRNLSHCLSRPDVDVGPKRP